MHKVNLWKGNYPSMHKVHSRDRKWYILFPEIHTNILQSPPIIFLSEVLGQISKFWFPVPSFGLSYNLCLLSIVYFSHNQSQNPKKKKKKKGFLVG